MAVIRSPDGGGAVRRLDTQPALLAAARRLRRRLPGDERFGDPLSTAGETPVQVVARGVSALRPERESVVQELGMAGSADLAVAFRGRRTGTGRARDGPAVHRSRRLLLLGAEGRRRGRRSSCCARWAPSSRAAVLARDGRIVKRLGDGLMATFLERRRARSTRRSMPRTRCRTSRSTGYRPRMRAGVHWGRPRKLGGDYLGVDVNIAARVGDAGKADQVVVSETVLERVDVEALNVGRRKRSASRRRAS